MRTSFRDLAEQNGVKVSHGLQDTVIGTVGYLCNDDGVLTVAYVNEGPEAPAGRAKRAALAKLLPHAKGKGLHQDGDTEFILAVHDDAFALAASVLGIKRTKRRSS